jgi:hypothetical protein
MTDVTDTEHVALQSPVEANRRHMQRPPSSSSVSSDLMNKSLVSHFPPLCCVFDPHLTSCLSRQASASVFVDIQDALKLTKTGKLTGGNFIASESSVPVSTASTPCASRPPSTLPSHSYTLHQVLNATLTKHF